MPNTSKTIISVVFSSFLWASLGLGSENPNIVLLMGDDHGWDETGYNGHPHLHTPVLDEMAASGLRMDRFYAAHPTCSPTRGSVLTGRHPNRYGTFKPNFSIRPEEITIADLLGEAGYICGHFGKWHLGPVKADSPTNPGALGFDYWLSHDNFFELDPWLSRNGRPPKKFNGESSEIVINETIEFLDAAIQGNKPFFAVIWFGSPHEPYSGLAKDLRLYDSLPSEYAQKQFKLTSNKTGRPTSRPLDVVLRERYAEITAMDRAIGKLRFWLSENSVNDNTLLWYCGDNGTPGDGIVTSPLRGKKGDHFEGGVRVPGLIEWPAMIKSQVTSDVNCVTSDILPTVCDVVQVPIPNLPLDGISLRPMIQGMMKHREKPICFWSFDTKQLAGLEPRFSEEDQRGTTPLVKKMGNLNTRNFVNYRYPTIREKDFGGTRAILTDNYKLILQGNHTEPRTSLYDIRKDPGETTNLVSEKPTVASELDTKLTKWQRSVLESLLER